MVRFALARMTGHSPVAYIHSIYLPSWFNDAEKEYNHGREDEGRGLVKNISPFRLFPFDVAECVILIALK